MGPDRSPTPGAVGLTGAAALESISLLQRIYDIAAVLPGPDLG